MLYDQFNERSGMSGMKGSGATGGVTMTRGAGAGLGGVGGAGGRAGTWAERATAKNQGVTYMMRDMSGPLEVLKGEIGGRRAHSRHNVVLIKRRLDELHFVAIVTRFEPGHLRQHQFEILQQVVQADIRSGR